MPTDPDSSSSPIAPSPAPRFLDLWGHFIWMSFVCTLCTVFTGQWQFIVTFASIELVQFCIHAKEHHPDHPLMTSWEARLFLMVPVLALTAFIAATGFPHLIAADEKLTMFMLIGLQVGVSRAIHLYVHAKTDGNSPMMEMAKTEILIFLALMVFVGLL